MHPVIEYNGCKLKMLDDNLSIKDLQKKTNKKTQDCAFDQTHNSACSNLI